MTRRDGPGGVRRRRRLEARLARRARRRRRGIGLIVFGTAGLVLIGAAALLLGAGLGAVGDPVTGLDRQRAELVALIGPASDALDDAAASASNATDSLSETRDAAASGARLTARLAESFEGLAALGSFELLGQRPFASMAGQFAAVAGEARTLSGELDAATAAMERNIADTRAVASDLRALATQLDRLEARVNPSGAPASPDSASMLPVGAVAVVLYGLLAWAAIPALGCIWLGRRWSRPGPRVDRVVDRPV